MSLEDTIECMQAKKIVHEKKRAFCLIDLGAGLNFSSWLLAFPHRSGTIPAMLGQTRKSNSHSLDVMSFSVRRSEA